MPSLIYLGLEDFGLFHRCRVWIESVKQWRRYIIWFLFHISNWITKINFMEHRDGNINHCIRNFSKHHDDQEKLIWTLRSQVYEKYLVTILIRIKRTFDWRAVFHGWFGNLRLWYLERHLVANSKRFKVLTDFLNSLGLMVFLPSRLKSVQKFGILKDPINSKCL